MFDTVNTISSEDNAASGQHLLTRNVEPLEKGK